MLIHPLSSHLSSVHQAWTKQQSEIKQRCLSFKESLSNRKILSNRQFLKNKQSGFTLIELMIVVAIIGVLSAIAVPLYQDYVKKSELTAAVSSLKNLRTTAELYYQENGDITSSTDMTAALGITSDITKLGTFSISATNVIQMVLSQRPDVVLSLTRTAAGWRCSAQGLKAEEIPKGCQ